MLDLIIRHGTVIDGSGGRSPGFRADVGVGNGHILAVGDLSGAIGAREIDATDRCVSPVPGGDDRGDRQWDGGTR
jgi:N-acyl-D-amino-acid deacylase